MKNTLLIFLVSLIGIIPSSYASGYDDEEQFLRLGIEPLCTVGGQVTLTLTNVSGQRLLVEPHYLDSSLFDAVNQGMYLSDTAGNVRVRLKANQAYNNVEDWGALPVGEVVSHQIDYRDYANLDLNKVYRSGAAIELSILKENGEPVDIYLGSAFLLEFYEIEPSCFK